MTKRFLHIFYAPVFNLKISEDLGVGIMLSNFVSITNNSDAIRSTFTDTLISNIGTLEYNALSDASAVFYVAKQFSSVERFEVSRQNAEEQLCEFLYTCTKFLNLLWLKRDHSAFYMLGYSELREMLPEGKLISHLVNSNTLAGNSYLSTGKYASIVMSKQDIEDTAKLDLGFKVNPYSEMDGISSGIHKGNPKLAIAFTFLNTARSQSDLGIRISHFCSIFECLFSNDNKEVSHKIAERIAFFLEKDPENRYSLFKLIKDIYSIRSEVVHGSFIDRKKYHRLEYYSVNVESIARRILTKILASKYFDTFYKYNETEKMEEIFNRMIFGCEQYD